jgi:hypothetical protein
VKVREPVARPLDVVAAELFLSSSQAFLAGVLFYLAVGVWDDRGVGFGPVAIVLAMLGAAVGGSWLYWLLGGVGWPLAAANVPVAMFLGFALVLGWRGDDLFRVSGAPLLLSLAASAYGIVCGVFLDSPRRWRWDQRQKPRPGTTVPRVSPATKSVVAQVPRTLPKRPTTVERADLLSPAGAPSPAAAPGVEGAPGASGADGRPGSGPADIPYLVADDADGQPTDPARGIEQAPGSVDGAESGPGPSGSLAGASGASMPTERLDQAARAGSTPAPVDDGPPGAEPGGIELPTAIEPKAQKSPWAWAAPPEWNRDEDDEPDPPSAGWR